MTVERGQRGLAGFHRLRRRGEDAAAEDELRALADAGLDEASVEIARARLALDRDDPAAALPGLVRAAELDPGDDEAIAWRVAALSRLCRFEEAVAVAEQGLVLFPGSTRIGVALGRVYEEWDRPFESLERLESVLERHPDDEHAWEWLVYVLMVVNRYAEAESRARTALERCPESVGILDSLARVLAYQNRHADALECYERAVRADPDDSVAVCGRIRVLRNAHRYEEAEEAVAEAVRRLPRAADLLVQRSYLAEDQGRLDEALAHAERALELRPRDEDACEQRVSLLVKTHRYEEAEEAARRYIDEHPRSPDLAASLAWVYYAQDRYEDMVAAWERVLDVHDRFSAAVYGRAMGLRRLGRHAEAEQALAAGVELLPHRDNLYLEWCILLDERERHAEALERVDRALELDPYSVVTHTWRIIELRKLHRYAEAEEAARSGYETLRHPDMLEALADVYADQDRNAEALAEYRRASRLAPADTWPLRRIIRTLQALCRYDEAEAEARRAIERFPDESGFLSDLGQVYLAQDLDERALEMFRRAADLDPGDVDHQVRVADALFYLRRFGEAEAHLTEALRERPGDARLERTLGGVLSYQGRHESAYEHFTKAQGPEVDSTTAWRVAALRRSGRLEEAETLARDAIRRRPDIGVLHGELAEALQDQGRFEEAERTLLDALRRLSGDAGLSEELVGLYQWLGRHEDALAECDRVLAAEPRSATALRMRVHLLGSLNRHEEGLRAAEAAAELHPGDSVFAVEAGWLRYQLGRYGEALATFESAAALDGDRAACYGRAAALCELDRHAEAVRLLREEAALRPNYAQTWAELADAYEDEGRYEDALEAAEQAVRVDPYHVNGHEARVAALRRLCRLDEAEAAAAEAAALLPRDATVAIGQGRLRDARKDHAGALAHYDRALALRPLSNNAMVARSATLRSLRRFTEAEQMISEAVGRFPTFEFLRTEFGWIRRDQGRGAEARRIFERLRDAAVSPFKRAEACAGLGWVAFTGDDHPTAERHFRDACRANPRAYDCRVGLAWALVVQDGGRPWTEAETLCLDVLEKRPGDLLAHTCLGVLYYRRGEYAASEHHFEQTIELNPYDGSYVDLGALYVQMGRFEEAEEKLGKALELDWYDAQAHIEYGNLCLQWEGDEDETAARGRRAVRHFRQALAVSPASAPAAIGLAIALTRAPGDFVAAEQVLRDAVRRAGDGPERPKLLLALGRLLVERGDAAQRPELYREAVTAAQEAIERAGTDAEAYFVAGIATYKVGASDADVRTRPFYRRRAVRYLRECVRRDPEHVEGRRLLLLAQENLKTARGGAVGSFVMITLATSLLVTLWVSFFLSNRITSTVLATLTPVLVGLVALGFVLPLLVKLKLPGGVEADLSASLQQVSSGPTGDVSVGPGRIGGQGADAAGLAPFGAGPRGQLPRLE